MDPASDRVEGRFQGALVLLAEDNPVNQVVALHMLENLGCQVETAGDGREAVEAMLETRFDLVLMDCQMPEMDGYTATMQIRRQESGTRHTPVIAMTANAMVSDRDKCIQAGMDDFISKPVNPKRLTQVIARWGGESRSGQSLSDDEDERRKLA